MTRVELERLLRDMATGLERSSDQAWSFTAHEVPMEAFTNQAKDRMRLLAPVAAAEALETEQLLAALRAGFQLEARYALHRDHLYAVFTHTLSDLSVSLLESALRQLATLVTTFGTSYTSGPMRFDLDRDVALGSPSPVRRRTEEAVQSQIDRARRRDKPKD